MKHRVATYWLPLLFCLSAFAQQQDTTHVLPPVTIYADAVPENKLQKQMDSTIVQFQLGGSLDQLLQRNSTLYIRQYGSGTLSTINSLGLNASHHPIIWNDILFNNPMNGVQDINLLPLWFIQTTASDANYINTGSSTSFISSQNTEPQFDFYSTWNTMKNSSVGIKLKQNIKRLAVFAATIHSRNKNSIPYYNIYEEEKVKLSHAQAQQSGGILTLTYALNDWNTLESGLWYVTADRLIPPTMLQMISKAVEYDKQLRAYLQWTYNGNKLVSIVQTSINEDLLLYNDTLIALFATNHATLWQNQWKTKWVLNKRFLLSSIVRNQYIQSKTDNYSNRITQQRFSIQISPYYDWIEIKTGFRFSLNREFVLGGSSPSAQILEINTNLSKHLVLSQEVSSLYQLPTLNDWYWSPGGNPDLLPERSRKYRSTVRLFHYGTISLDNKLSGFFYDSKNTIVWRPSGSLWSPMNLRETHSLGLTDQVQLSWKNPFFNILLESSYTYNQTRVVASYDPNDMSLNKEIPYSPQHHSFSSLHLSKKNFSILIQHQYTGVRYSTFDESSQLRAYQILDFGVRYVFTLSKVQSDVILQMKNIFDTPYQTIAWQAMPGRHLQIQLQFKIINHKQKTTVEK